MNPYLIRQLWSLIESSHSNMLLSLDDRFINVASTVMCVWK
jgi:hypothetical protein